MSAAELQRVVVRMLYDPAFVSAVYEAPERALADVDVTADERGWIVSADRRVWGADAMRRKRSLKALLDEFRVSSALVVASTRRLATLDAFFSSRIFHDCIQHRGSMAMAYADYLGDVQSDPRTAAVVMLERAMAQARRSRQPAQAAGQLEMARQYQLSAHVRPVLLPAGTMDAMHAVERVLFEISLAPIAALADDGPDLSALPPLGEPGAIALTVERSGEGDEVALAEATPSLVALLEFAFLPRTGFELVQKAQELGAEAEEASEILQPLLDERVMTLARRQPAAQPAVR